MSCIIHSWKYHKSTRGDKNPLTGKRITREDRVCKDCGRLQMRLSQFPKEKQRELRNGAKGCCSADWLTYKEADKVDKKTMRWLKTIKFVVDEV